MTRKSRVRHLRYFVAFVLFCLALFAIAAARLVYAEAGWILVTLACTGAGFAAGWHTRAVRTARTRGKLAANSRYGQTAGYRGGSVPREPVTDANAVSAYPADYRAELLNDPRSGVRPLSRKDGR